MVSREDDAWMMESRWAGQTHRIALNLQLEYSGPSFSATLDSRSLAIKHIEASASQMEGGEPSLIPCATMFTLLKGLKESMPHLPVAGSAGHSETGRIKRPVYEEQTI